VTSGLPHTRALSARTDKRERKILAIRAKGGLSPKERKNFLIHRKVERPVDQLKDSLLQLFPVFHTSEVFRLRIGQNFTNALPDMLLSVLIQAGDQNSHHGLQDFRIDEKSLFDVS